MSARKLSRLKKNIRDKAKSILRGRTSKALRAANRLYWTVSTPIHRVLGQSTVRITMPPDQTDIIEVVDLETCRRLRFTSQPGNQGRLSLDLLDNGRWQPVGNYSDQREAAYEGLRLLVQERVGSTRIEPTKTITETAGNFQVGEDEPIARMLRFGEQWQTSLHRSGWGYALAPLQNLRNDQGVLFDGFLEETFCWRDTGRIYRKPWVGVVHNPPQMPKWYSDGKGTNRQMTISSRWLESLDNCRGLFVLSEYHRQALQPRVKVPVSVLTHPTETPRLKFDAEKFHQNPQPKLVQIGVWLRNPNSLYKIKSSLLGKARLDVGYPWEEEVRRNLPRESLNLDSVEVIARLENEAYDRLLAENVVFLDLLDASANNAVIECIVRHTPILVNKHPAIIEYLGEDYPLFYQDLEEASRKSSNRELILQAHEYLKEMPKERFTQEAFLKQVIQSEVYQSLLPSPVEPFVLLAHARSGSTSLMSALEAHKQICFINEPFSPTRNPWGHPYREDVTDIASLNTTLDEIQLSHNGIKHLICQLTSEGNETLIGSCKRTILLTRRNLLHAVVSGKIADQTNVWQGSNEQIKRMKLQPLDLPELEGQIAIEREQIDNQRQFLADSGQPYIEVFYEDLYGPDVPIDERLKIYNQILEFLGADATDESTQQAARRLFDPNKSKLTSESTYRKLPNADQIDIRLGNPTTGFLFDQDQSPAINAA